MYIKTVTQKYHTSPEEFAEVEFVTREEAGEYQDAEDADGDAAPRADNGAFQREAHRDESLQREQQHKVAGTDLTVH